MSRICFLLVLFSVSVFSNVFGQPPPDAPLIRHITIEGNTRTRTQIIQRELLFSAGEPLDTTRIDETTRNLRRLFFLGRVDIQLQEENDMVDVLVYVEDLYARALSPTVSGKLGELSYGLFGLDYNFLGRGQVVQLTLQHDAVTGNRVTAHFQQPRLRGSRHALTTRLGVGEEGHDLQVTLSKPFYRLSSKWSYGVSLFSQKQVTRLYTNQIVSERYDDRRDVGSAWLTRSYGDRIKVRPNIQLDISDRRFTPTSGFTYAPDNRRRILPSVGMTLWQPRFEKVRYIQYLGRMEDLQTGSWLSTRAGFSDTRLGSDQSFRFIQAQIAPRFKPYENGYTFIRLFIQNRHQEGRFTNIFVQTEMVTYARIGRAHNLAMRVRWDLISRPEDTSQLLLGVERGLRGYAPRRFEGTRRFLMNLEGRPTLYHHEAFVLGGVIFVDSGTTWTPGQTDPGLNTSAGIGLRVGMTRVYNNPILRADLAYGFQDRTWQFWLGVGQYF